MTTHNAPSTTAAAAAGGRHRGRLSWIATGQPDLFRRAGVPDRLVLVLNRDGLHYIGTLTTWEYREIDVRRTTREGGDPVIVREMVVDASYPTQVEITVQMSRRPTVARVVQELVDALRGIIGRLPDSTEDLDDPPRCPDCICCSWEFCTSAAGECPAGWYCPCKDA